VSGARHFASQGYIVVCGGQELRHHLGRPWSSPDDAEQWAETAHCCPGRHQVIRAGVLKETP